MLSQLHPGLCLHPFLSTAALPYRALTAHAFPPCSLLPLSSPSSAPSPSSPHSGRFLEEELARRYRDAAPATLALLQERCESVARDLIAADKKLAEAGDVVSLRRAGGLGGWVDGRFALQGEGHN